MRLFNLKDRIYVEGKGFGYISVLNHLTKQIGVHFDDDSIELVSVDQCKSLTQSNKHETDS